MHTAKFYALDRNKSATNVKIYLFLLLWTIAENVQDAKFVATRFAGTNIISLQSFQFAAKGTGSSTTTTRDTY